MKRLFLTTLMIAVFTTLAFSQNLHKPFKGKNQRDSPFLQILSKHLVSDIRQF